jgi:hypothetical protein
MTLSAENERRPVDERGERGLLRGPRAHSITWMIDDDWITGKVECHCVEGADCRMVCPNDCEAWNVCDHEHELVDAGRCLFVEWMEAIDSVQDAHVGSHALVAGFIEPEWDDDGFTWSYVDDDPAPSKEGSE